MNNIETMKFALEALENNKRTHHYCEDTWYSCPKHEDGCANDVEGDECNCGADKANAEIDTVMEALRQAIEQAQQAEPVAYIRVSKTGHVMACAKTENFFSLPHKTLLYTSPPQRQPLTDECKRDIRLAIKGYFDDAYVYGDELYSKIIDALAAHGIKGEA